MALSFGVAVLVPFPFTDQSGTKKRPAVIVCGSSYNTSRRGLVIMAITISDGDVRALRDTVAQTLG